MQDERLKRNVGEVYSAFKLMIQINIEIKSSGFMTFILEFIKCFSLRVMMKFTFFERAA